MLFYFYEECEVGGLRLSMLQVTSHKTLRLSEKAS